MNKKEIFFSGALFFSVCAISSNQWPSYAASICVVCALCSAVLFWRGLALCSAAKTSRDTLQREEFQAHQATLLRAIETLEATVQSQGQSLAGQMAAVQDTAAQAEAAMQTCVDLAASRLDSNNAQIRKLLTQHSQTLQDAVRIAAEANEQLSNLNTNIRADLDRSILAIQRLQTEQDTYYQKLLECAAQHSEQLRQSIDRQHRECQAVLDNISGSDLPGIYMMIQEVEKALTVLPEAAESSTGEISNALSSLQRGLDDGVRRMESQLRQGCDQTEAYFERLQKAFDGLGRSLEIGNERQRDWMDLQIKQYQSITEQDLEALHALLEE